MTRKMILAGVGVAGVLAIGGTATAALADSGSTATPQPGSTAHAAKGSKALARLCNREPKRAQRVDKLIARYSGSATSKGSVAWLNAKATKLQSTNPGLAKIISDEAKVRQSAINTLKLRKNTEADTVSYCAAKGHPVHS